MNLTASTAEIDFQKLARSHSNHDAATQRSGSVASLLARWDGPIRIDAWDVNLSIDAGLAFACVRPSNSRN